MNPEDLMRRGVWVIFIFVLSMAVMALAGGNRGAKEIDISAGHKGNVHFPHHAHQDALNDCNACHSVFPQKAGGISELMGTGELVRKQVMNDVCRKCHKEREAARQKTGPTACAKCHMK